MKAYTERSSWKRSVTIWLLSVAMIAGVGATPLVAATGKNRAELSPAERAAVEQVVAAETARRGTLQTQLLTQVVTKRLASLRMRPRARELTEVVRALVDQVARELDEVGQTEDSRRQAYRKTVARPAGAEASSIPSSERQALIDLYNSTNGPEWKHNTNWLGPVGTECTWEGVTCDAERTTVVGLVFMFNNMQGPLPPSLESLTNLQTIFVGWTPLTGPIPPELANLTNLRSLELVDTELTGPIPLAICDLPNLQTLNLGGSQLTGEIPPELANLSNLKVLRLYTNRFTGPIPPELATMTKLEQLDLEFNQLTGPIPPELGNLSNLITLYLLYNEFEGSIPVELTHLGNLKILDLRSDHLTGPIPPELGNLSNLASLGLDFNQLTGPIPPELGNLGKLQFLSLGSNHLTGSIPAEIGNLGSLLTLELPSCQLTGQLPSSLTNLTSLMDGDLDLRWNGLSASYPALVDFLDAKQKGGDWQNTQTVPVSDLAVADVSNSKVSLTWTPIAYQQDGGGYKVFLGPSGGPYASAGSTTDKSAEGFTVTSLDPGTEYCFVVRTFTPPHAHNESEVVSDPSPEVCATTTTALEITTHSPLHSGNVGTAYNVHFAINCPNPPCGNWHIAGGTLPPDLSLDPGTGVLAGTPTAEGRYTFVVQVGDSVGNSASKVFVLTILAAGANPIPTLGGGGLVLLALILAVAGVIALRLRPPGV